MTPTVRTLARLRQMGYVADVVERWLPRVGVRRDLFHCIDIVAVHPAIEGVLGVQCTSKPNLAARVGKVRQQPEVAIWLKASNRIEVWGWHKRNGRWDAERIEVLAGDLQPAILTPRRRPGRKRRGERQGELFAGERHHQAGDETTWTRETTEPGPTTPGS